eukprot:222429-Chlamydomonas_euryale.AAC.1
MARRTSDTSTCQNAVLVTSSAVAVAAVGIGAQPSPSSQASRPPTPPFGSAAPALLAARAAASSTPRRYGVLPACSDRSVRRTPSCALEDGAASESIGPGSPSCATRATGR